MHKKNQYGLTGKQEEFCQEYIRNKGNASAAYRHAYDADGCTAESINQLSCVLMRDVNISSRVKTLQDQYAKQWEITLEEVVSALREAKELARAEVEITNLRGSAMDLAKIGGLGQKQEIDVTISEGLGAILGGTKKRATEES